MKFLSVARITALALALTPASAAAHATISAPLQQPPVADTPATPMPAMPVETPTPEATPAPEAPEPQPQEAPAPTFNIPAGYTYAGYEVLEQGIYNVFYNERAPENWQSMLALAAQHWQSAPNCPNGITMLTMTPGYARTGAAATVGGCRMWISINNIARNPDFRSRCILVAHEYGHLLGRRHSPNTLMAEDGTIYNMNVPACGNKPSTEAPGKPVGASDGFVPATILTFKVAKEMTEDVLPKSWKVAGCKRVSKFKVRCAMRKVVKGKASKRKKIITVKMDREGASYTADYE